MIKDGNLKRLIIADISILLWRAFCQKTAINFTGNKYVEKSLMQYSQWLANTVTPVTYPIRA